MKSTSRGWVSACLYLTFCSVPLVDAATVAPSWELAPHQQKEGVFWRTHWYERDAFTPRVGYTRRPRINAANAVLDERWGVRTETKENGLLLIRTEEDLFQTRAAELYAELWGGHPGTANKRFTINGRSTYQLPRNGTEAAHCTYSYPVIPLAPTDVVNGFNAVQWAVDPGTTFWGHSMVDNACIRFALTNSHPDLVEWDLSEFSARLNVQLTQRPQTDQMKLQLTASPQDLTKIDRVEFQGWYTGYDDNGNNRATDWHGFTKNQQLQGHLGTVLSPPFTLTWNTSMLPAQKNVAVRAFIHFKERNNLQYVTEATTGLALFDRPHTAVHLYSPPDLPESFWSRANRPQTCSFTIFESPEQIESAELYVIGWTGGAGTVKDYFTLNEIHFPIAEGEAHEIQFNRLAVDPSILRQGKNTIRLLSDTEHHGIEIIYPGPALMVRYRY